MNRKSFFLITIALFTISLSFSGCYLTSQIIPPSININFDNSSNYDDSMNNTTSPSPSHIQFENTIQGKVWFTRILDEGDYNKRLQIKLQFNTSGKTLKKEVFYWQRINNSNSYSYIGKKVQIAAYSYGAQSGEFEYKIIEDYYENAFGARENHMNVGKTYSVWCNLDNAEMMTWDGKQYISQRALQNQSVKNYTEQKNITLNY